MGLLINYGKQAKNELPQVSLGDVSQQFTAGDGPLSFDFRLSFSLVF
jgi:hypothetical protein